MTEIKQNVSLKPYTTFGIDVLASRFTEINSLNDLFSLPEIKSTPQPRILILGGGSNILFVNDFDGIVIKNNLKGIEIIKETDTEVWIKAASGEIWHQLVLYCVSKNYGGIENLSLIPGTVGAAPMQNIGAYGVELKDVFDSLEAVNLNNLETSVFNHEQCRFGYRESVFKHQLKDQYFIASVTIRLQKFPKINSSYGQIKSVLEKEAVTDPTIADISRVVCQIRSSKLPDPAVIGNAGSFFKNPEITDSQFEKLKNEYPHIPGYKTETGMKVPAAWLIESCGWKGKRIGETGTHVEHALVLVNYGHAKGSDIKTLALEIIKSVKDKFDINLHTEVNII